MALLPGVHNRFCICSSISSMSLWASFWDSYAIFKAKNWSSIRFLHSADTQSLQNVAWKLSRYLDSLNFPPKAVVLIRLTGVYRRSSWNSVAVWFHGMWHSSYLTPCFQNRTVPHLLALWELKLGARCDFLIPYQHLVTKVNFYCEPLRVPVKYDPTIHSQPKIFFLPGLKLPPRGVNPSQIELPIMQYFHPKSPDKDLGPYKCDFRDFKVRTSNGCSFQGFSRNFPKFGVEVSLETYYWPKKKFWKFEKNFTK